jgi:hypothetical protein
MVKPVLGGPGPSKKLFHYGGAIQGVARKFSFWTDYDSTDKDKISSITGVPAMNFKFKNVVMVNERRIDEFFRNEATAMKPGIGAYDEYKNKVEIPSSYIETTPLP